MIRNLVATLALVMLAAPAWGQDVASEELFGRGVHAYHSGTMQESYDLLSRAVEAGSVDPRAYYFRGLAALSMGMEDAAHEDFSVGAEMEAADATTRYTVDASLERVQGRTRLQLERYRTAGRANARNRRLDEIRSRYGELRESDKSYLFRNPNPAPSSARDPFQVEPGDINPGKPQDPAPEPEAEQPTTQAPPATQPPRVANRPMPEPPVVEKPAVEPPAPAEPPVPAGGDAPGRTGRFLRLLGAPLVGAAQDVSEQVQESVPNPIGPAGAAPAEFPQDPDN